MEIEERTTSCQFKMANVSYYCPKHGCTQLAARIRNSEYPPLNLEILSQQQFSGVISKLVCIMGI
jgi:hypothetical protein